MKRPPVHRSGRSDNSPAIAMAVLTAAAAAPARRKVGERRGAVSGRNPATLAEPPSYPYTRRTPCVE